MANQQIVVRQLEMPVIDDPIARGAAVRFQAAETIAMPLDETVLDYQAIGAVEGSDGVVRERLLLVAARESMINRLMDAIRGAGLKADGIDLNAFALVRMLGDEGGEALEPAQPARVICHLGGVTNLAIAAGPICLFTRPLQTVWSSDDDATVDSLAEEIRLSLDFHMAQANARAVESVVLAGPGATDERVASELASRTGLPVSVGDPLGAFGDHTVPARRRPCPLHRRGRPGAGGPVMRAVNLLPERDRARGPAKVPDGSSRLVLGVLGGLLVVVMVVVFTQNQITDRNAQIAKARQEQQQAEQRAAALGSFGEFSQIKKTRVDSISQLAKSRFDYERLMRELALVLPHDVWVISADAASTGAPGETGSSAAAPAPSSGSSAPSTPPSSGTPAPGASAATPSVKIIGCAKTQPKVAETIVRLRNLHRAEDVELTDSTRTPQASGSGASGATSSTGCGKHYSFDTTVTFSPAPAHTTQGERSDPVPGTLGGGA